METPPPAVEGEAEQAVGTQSPTSDQAGSQDPSAKASLADIDALPEDLKPLAKQLLGDYTRKTQELSALKDKASAFDELTSNQGFMEMMDNLERYGSPTAPPPPPVNKQSGEELLLKMIEDPEYFWKQVDERAEAKALAHTAPISEREALASSEAEIARLSTLYPDFQDHSDQIAEMIEKSGYTLDPEVAYKALTYENVKARGVEEGARITENRVKVAGNSGLHAQVQGAKLFTSMADAYAAAKKAHGG